MVGVVPTFSYKPSPAVALGHALELRNEDLATRARQSQAKQRRVTRRPRRPTCLLRESTTEGRGERRRGEDVVVVVVVMVMVVKSGRKDCGRVKCSAATLLFSVDLALLQRPGDGER